MINNKALGKTVEIQAGSYEHHMLATTEESGYTVPDFEKVAKAYGIKAGTFNGYEKLDVIKGWLTDEKPCLINIMLPDATILQPKMNWNDYEMKPVLSDEVMDKAKRILG